MTLTKIDWNAVARVGIPGVIAMFLVWKLADGFDIFDKRLQAVELQHATMIQHSERIEDLMGRAYMGNERTLYVLKIMCVQNAKTAQDRRDCLQEP